VSKDRRTLETATPVECGMGVSTEILLRARDSGLMLLTTTVILWVLVSVVKEASM